MKKMMCFLLIFRILTSVVSSEESNITALEIIEKIQQHFSKIKDYTVDLHAVINMEDVHIPPMDVKVYFKQPDKVFIKSDGFAMLPREGILQNPGKFNQENFYIELTGQEILDSVQTYKLELIPRNEETMARKIKLWIDSEKWTIKRLESTSWQGQKTTINFIYEKIQDKYWLPIRTIADISLTGFVGFGQMMEMQKKRDLDSKKERTGKLVIHFSNYKINKGLSDSIFEQSDLKF